MTGRPGLNAAMKTMSEMRLKDVNPLNMGRSPITCAGAVGIFKELLSRDERETFKKLLAQVPELYENAELALENERCIVYCMPLAHGARGYDPLETGGSCVISYRRNGDCTSSYVMSFMEKLNGSWSSAIIGDDGIFLGRDNAGGQSMYYAKVKDTLYFASSLSLLRNFSFTIDSNSISKFLHFLYIPAPDTIYGEVKMVLPGQVILVDGKIIREMKLPRKSFSKDRKDTEHAINENRNLETYEELLKKSVQKCCPKEGKIGLFLSGGKDSSALAIAINRGGIKNAEAVTLGFSEREIDESDDAGIVADYLGIPFRPLKLPAEKYLRLWPEFIQSLGQPMGDCAALPVFAAMKEFERDFDIFLDGTGNDRYLGITTTWQEDLAWHLNHLIPGLHYLPWTIAEKGISYSADVLARSFMRPREEQFVSWKGWTAREIDRLTGRTATWDSIRLYGLYRNCSSPMVHKTMTLCDIWEPETAFRKVVQVANTLGKSVRFPFLDRQLVAFSQNLPCSVKYSERINKVIIRKLLQRYLPEKIVKKKKGTFSFPKKYIMSSHNYEILDIFLSPSCLQKHGWIDYPFANKYLSRFRNGDNSLEDRVWALLILHAWAELGKK
jgi:asparagine synthase (glutamine-hydrolysing)